MNRPFIFFLTFISIILAPHPQLAALEWNGNELVIANPQAGTPMHPVTAGDINADGKQEQIILADHRATLMGESRTLWQTPPEWDVRQAEVTDLNRDHVPEVTLLLWRPFAPWLIDAMLPHGGRISSFQDQENRSCHIILIGWKRGAFRELWAGSPMAEPILRFFPADWDGNGHQELLAVEGEYTRPEEATAVTLWEWNGFGFTLSDRMRGETNRAVLLNKPGGSPLLLLELSKPVLPSREVEP